MPGLLPDNDESAVRAFFSSTSEVVAEFEQNAAGEDIEERGDSESIVRRIIRATVRIETTSDYHQRLQRLYNYALSKLHSKHESLDWIAEQVQDVWPDRQGHQKIRRWLHYGNRWSRIFDLFAEAAGTTTEQSTGLLGILHPMSR